MIRRPPRSTLDLSSAASDVYKRQVLLSEELNHSYTYLANFFSEIEATTIEQFIIALKIERIKELILFGEDSISEIAHKLHYSSAVSYTHLTLPPSDLV